MYDACKRYDKSTLWTVAMLRNLQRYIHYNSRWEAHVASQKLEARQVADIREKIAELEDNGTQLKDYTWLSQVVLICHSILHAASRLTYLPASILANTQHDSMLILLTQGHVNQHITPADVQCQAATLLSVHASHADPVSCYLSASS